MWDRLQAPPAPGQTEWTKTTLHAFNSVDGAAPTGKLLVTASGVIYGTTAAGGNGQCEDGYGHIVGCGAIFELIPPAPGQTSWTEKVIYNFNGLPDGIDPEGGLIQDQTGNFYGTTASGGPSGNCVDHVRVIGCGTAFN